MNLAFKEPLHKILETIKHETFLRWPSKMSGDPSRRNRNLYCIYHKEKTIPSSNAKLSEIT